MRTFFIVAFLLVFSAPVMAQESVKPIKVAVVDIQQLMTSSEAGKSIQKQGEDLKKKYQKKISKLEEGLKKSEEKVVKAGQDQDKEAFIENRKTFQKELVESQKELKSLNQKLDKAVGNALNTLRDKILSIVEAMAKDNQYDLVISRSDVVIVSKDIDITAEVMKKLNSALSSVKVKD